jgi:outer membrane receptor protein involved in Fe transport
LPVATYTSVGVYVQDEFALLRDKLALSLGGRYDHIGVKNEKVLNPLYHIVDGIKNETPAHQTVLWTARKVSDRSWSGNAGLLFHISRDFDITATVGRSFRSPYLEERYQYIDLGSLVKFGDPNLLPEEGVFFDFGLRLWKPSYRFTADVYYNDLKNLVVESPAVYEGRQALKKKNVGSAELYGFDAAAECSLSKRSSVHANIAYVRGRDTYSGSPLALIPPLNGKIGVNSSVAPFFSVDIAATLFARQGRIADWEYTTDGYAYFDIALISQRFSLVSIQSRLMLGIDNVLDKSYRNHLASNRGSITAEPGRNFWIRFQLER